MYTKTFFFWRRRRKNCFFRLPKLILWPLYASVRFNQQNHFKFIEIKLYYFLITAYIWKGWICSIIIVLQITNNFVIVQHSNIYDLIIIRHRLTCLITMLSMIRLEYKKLHVKNKWLKTVHIYLLTSKWTHLGLFQQQSLSVKML